EELLRDDLERDGRALSAVLGGDGELPPARLVEALPHALERAWHGDLPVLEAAPLAIAERVRRPDHLGREAVALVDHHLHFVGTPLGERLLAEDVREPELLE